MTATTPTDLYASRIAAAIGVPTRARMLFALVGGQPRTSTELALIADVAPSTASVHLRSLALLHLVEVGARGKHRFYRLGGPRVAAALEALSVLAGGAKDPAALNTVQQLRVARSCYDHLAGALGVAVYARFTALGWLSRRSTGHANARDLTPAGTTALTKLGMDLASLGRSRRRFAYACLDWSERLPHLAGALGSGLLGLFETRRWVVRESDGRALTVTSLGRRVLWSRFGVRT